MKNLLNVKNLSMSFDVEPLYEDVNFGIAAGERIAVVGPNGSGKSTLFKLLTGELTPDAGEVVYRGETTFGYLAQTEQFDEDDTPRRIVARAMKPVRDAIDEHERISEQLAEPDDADESLEELLDRQSSLQERIQKVGGWSWEHRVEEMLDRLGVTDWIDEPIASLSGGQRRRVDLARVLLEAPDLLLLDEPTNHLDTTAVEWLERWLADQVDTVMFVTHDRYFLERIADRIIEIADDGLYDYPGNYQTFIERKLHRREVNRRTEKRRQKELKKELEWLKGGIKSQNTRSKKRIRKIEEMKSQKPLFVERDITMELGEPSEFGDVIANARGLWKSYDGETLLRRAHFEIRPEDKIGVIGPNGCGKSTLLNILAERERYDAGVVEIGKKTDIAHLHQDSPRVDPDETVYDAFSDSDYVWIGDHRYHKQSYLRRFLFDRPLQKSRIKSLSGGQKRRFALAKVFAENPNLLLLDEPTNDLDIMSLEALEQAVEDFEGCVVAVSHDRYFLNRICNAIVAFEDGRLERYEGNYDDYRKRRDDAEEPSESTPKKTPPKKASSKSEPNGRDKKKKGLSWREKRKLEEIEEDIQKTEHRRDELRLQLADPELYESNTERIEPLNRELEKVRNRLDELWDEWSDLERRRGD